MCSLWKLVLSLALLGFQPLATLHARDLSYATPASLGFSAERLAQIDSFYKAKVDKGALAGIVLLVARHGKIAHFSAVGYADTATKRKLEKDAIFRVYSMTKPIAATALMMLYEEGKFRLDDPISKYIPEFKGIRVLRTPGSALADTVPAVREPTIHDLFRHSAGFIHGPTGDRPIGKAYKQADLFNRDLTLDGMMKRLAKIPLAHQPGTKWDYSIAPDIEARLVEIFSGMPFDAFLKARLFDPLGMKDTAYWLAPDNQNRFVPVHVMEEGKIVPCKKAAGCDPFGTEMNDYSSVRAHRGGSLGLTGTAEDYWRFAQMMGNGGTFEGKRYLSPVTVRYMTRNHLGSLKMNKENGEDSGGGFGLGFGIIEDSVASGSLLPEGSFYWAGAARTSFWIDPKNDIVVVAMTQGVGPNFEDADSQQIAALVYGALAE